MVNNGSSIRNHASYIRIHLNYRNGTKRVMYFFSFFYLETETGKHSYKRESCSFFSYLIFHLYLFKTTYQQGIQHLFAGCNISPPCPTAKQGHLNTHGKIPDVRRVKQILSAVLLHCPHCKKNCLRSSFRIRSSNQFADLIKRGVNRYNDSEMPQADSAYRT